MLTVIIPAFQEAERIGATMSAVCRAARNLPELMELLVVDDGSDDGTADRALAIRSELQRQQCSEERQGCQEPFLVRPADRTAAPSALLPEVRVLRQERNRGKGAAVAEGLAAARGELILLLDADLEETAAEFPSLVAPIRSGEADMTIAVFADGRRGAPQRSGGHGDGRKDERGSPPVSRLPSPVSRGGFGLALRTARWGVARLTGRVLQAPLSGQRALRAEHLPLLLPLEPGFGLEVGLDVDALRAGLRVVEVPTGMRHAATGRNWAGFRHRGRQLAHLLRALARRAVRGRKPAANPRPEW